MILTGLIQSIIAQKLNIELMSYSEPIELGKKVTCSLILTNNTDEDMIIFHSPMSDYGVGGYEYTVNCNGNQILHNFTRGLETNESFSEKSIGKLSPGEKTVILGLRSFSLDEVEKYNIHVTYYQDPTGLVESWAKNKKAIKLAKKITPYKTELNETIEIK